LVFLEFLPRCSGSNPLAASNSLYFRLRFSSSLDFLQSYLAHFQEQDSNQNLCLRGCGLFHPFDVFDKKVRHSDTRGVGIFEYFCASLRFCLLTIPWHLSCPRASQADTYFLKGKSRCPVNSRGETMKVFRKLLRDTGGQGLVEYTLIVFLVAFVFWVAIKDTTAGTAMGDIWSKVSDCVASPFSCSAGS
jgi:Flp pilus assembly pilin Flp